MTPVISGDLHRRNELLEFRPQTRRRRSNTSQTVKRLIMPRAFPPDAGKRGDMLTVRVQSKQQLRRLRSPLGETSHTVVTRYGFIAIDTACQENYNFTL